MTRRKQIKMTPCPACDNRVLDEVNRTEMCHFHEVYYQHGVISKAMDKKAALTRGAAGKETI